MRPDVAARETAADGAAMQADRAWRRHRPDAERRGFPAAALIPRKAAWRQGCEHPGRARAPERESIMASTDILAEVAAERGRQDARWGGSGHDDAMTMTEFARLIADYAGWARVKAREGALDEARLRFLQVAALAVAAVERVDRDRSGASAPAPAPRDIDWE
jgi:hypothetical protein